MGWRWRKSVGRGPLRITLSKKGVGTSIGVPGLRIGRSPDGRTYVSQGIPGTGLYRIKYSGGGKQQPTAPPGLPSPAPRAPLPAPHRPVPPRAPAPVQGHPAAPQPPAPAAKAAGGLVGAVTRFFDRLF